MNRDYKNFLSIVGATLFLIFLTGFQVSFINSSFLNLNLFLIVVLYLVFTKNNSKALFFAWLGGVLTGLSYFSSFGINSLVLLIIAAVLIILYKTVFLTLKTESILLISMTGVALYHFFDWLLTNGEFGFYFVGREILTELILTASILLIILKITTLRVVTRRVKTQNV